VARILGRVRREMLEVGLRQVLDELASEETGPGRGAAP
jgi:hypothetical protein